MDDKAQSLGFHPLYAQIKELLIQRVLDGEWRPGEVLPSEFKIAAEYEVSQGTVRKALDEMAGEKLVVRRQGKGTFVSARSSKHVPFHFFRLLNDKGHKDFPKTLTMENQLGEPNAAEQEALGIGKDVKVYRLERLRTIEGKPAIIGRYSVRTDMCPGIENMALDKVTNIYVLLEREYGLLVVKAVEKIRAVPADERDAGLLGIDVGSPLLEIERISLSMDGKPVEFRIDRFVTRNHHYLNEIT
ncbi:MAG: GntR family transcriptional regulator [Alphaproteobacteria bacterium]